MHRPNKNDLRFDALDKTFDSQKMRRNKNKVHLTHASLK